MAHGQQETDRITWLTTDVGTEEVRNRRIFNLMDGNENLKLMKYYRKAGKA
jgi:Mor family transcriptional regulator